MREGAHVMTGMILCERHDVCESVKFFLPELHVNECSENMQRVCISVCHHISLHAKDV